MTGHILVVVAMGLGFTLLCLALTFIAWGALTWTLRGIGWIMNVWLATLIFRYMFKNENKRGLDRKYPV